MGNNLMQLLVASPLIAGVLDMQVRGSTTQRQGSARSPP